MCFVKPPSPPPLPAPPTVSDAAVQQRQADAVAQLRASSGTAGTVKTDLSASDVQTKKRVLLGV